MTQELPHLAIGIITYKRYAMLKDTIDALIEHAAYPADKLHIVVSDDSTGGNKLSNLRRITRYKQWGTGIQCISTPQRSGWGANANHLLNYIYHETPAKYVFQIEDDYQIDRTLRLDVGAALLHSRPHIGMLRYRGTAGTRLLYHQFEADLQPYDLPVDAEEQTGLVSYLQIDQASQSVYIYSNGPHLKSLAFHEHYGQYPTGRKLGETEESYAHQVKDRMRLPNAPGIAILPEWVQMRFAHVGESFQLTEEDI